MATKQIIIGMVCRDNTGYNVASLGKKIRHVLVLIAKAIHIRDQETVIWTNYH